LASTLPQKPLAATTPLNKQILLIHPSLFAKRYYFAERGRIFLWPKKFFTKMHPMGNSDLLDVFIIIYNRKTSSFEPSQYALLPLNPFHPRICRLTLIIQAAHLSGDPEIMATPDINNFKLPISPPKVGSKPAAKPADPSAPAFGVNGKGTHGIDNVSISNASIFGPTTAAYADAFQKTTFNIAALESNPRFGAIVASMNKFQATKDNATNILNDEMPFLSPGLKAKLATPSAILAIENQSENSAT